MPRTKERNYFAYQTHLSTILPHPCKNQQNLHSLNSVDGRSAWARAIPLDLTVPSSAVGIFSLESHSHWGRARQKCTPWPAD